MSDILAAILSGIGGAAGGYQKNLDEEKALELAKQKNANSLINDLFQSYAKASFETAADNGQAPDLQGIIDQWAQMQGKSDPTKVGLSDSVKNHKRKLTLANVPDDEIIQLNTPVSAPQMSNREPTDEELKALGVF